MPSSLDFSKTIGRTSSGGSNLPPATGFIAVRVTEVNITPNEDEESLFQVMNKYWGVGAIRFEALNQPKPITDIPEGTVAIPLNSSVRTLPLINEIVYVILGPSRQRVLDGDSKSNIFYYTNSIPIWNSNEVNALPSIVSQGSTDTNSNTLDEVQAGIPNNPDNPVEGPKLGNVFKDNGNIKNLYPQEGDLILEGRFGNSLRFGSTGRFGEDYSDFDVNPQNPWSQNGQQGDPITILRNGQRKDAISFDVWQPIFEDVNDDESSIYLTSQQNIPLQIAYSNLKSYGVDVTPPEDTTKEFQKIGEELGDEFTSNNESDNVTSVRDSINVEPVGIINKPITFPKVEISQNLRTDDSVGSVPRDEFEERETPRTNRKRARASQRQPSNTRRQRDRRIRSDQRQPRNNRRRGR